MTHAGGGTRPPRAPLIGAGGLQPWPSGGFVGAQSATAPRPVTVTHAHTHRPWLIRLWLWLRLKLRHTGPGTEFALFGGTLVSPRILPWHDSRGKVRASTSVETRNQKPETSSSTIQTKPNPPRHEIVNHSNPQLPTSTSHSAASSRQPASRSPTRPSLVTCSPHYLPPTLPTLSFASAPNCIQTQPVVQPELGICLTSGPDLDAPPSSPSGPHSPTLYIHRSNL